VFYQVVEINEKRFANAAPTKQRQRHATRFPCPLIGWNDTQTHFEGPFGARSLILSVSGRQPVRPPTVTSRRGSLPNRSHRQRVTADMSYRRSTPDGQTMRLPSVGARLSFMNFPSVAKT
jgi:hypothetical protein